MAHAAAAPAGARPVLVVAGRSARLMAEGAARDGCDVIALDAYGDLDTRRVARHWQTIAAPGGTRLDAARLLAALDAAAREPGVIGWVAGSDFECEIELLSQGARRLPLLGTDAAAMRRVREPASFFEALRQRSLPHPETRLVPPDDPAGWLCKQARGSGGWHIRRAGDSHAAPDDRQPYWQREVAGRPMSVLFVADGRAARRLGLNALIVRPLGAHPHVYRGTIGPVALPPGVVTALDAMLDTLAARFALRGLGSLDFVLADDGPVLLEINPRPSASMASYADLPLMRWHVAACRDGVLPAPVASPAGPVRGSEIVFARTALHLTPDQADVLAARDDCHDLPAAGTRFAPGDPVCSVDAIGNNADEVLARLATQRAALRASLAQTGDRSP